MSEINNSEDLQFKNRYDQIEAANSKSWFWSDQPRKLEVVASVASSGPSRERGLARIALAGNMSEKYGDPSIPQEQWPMIANANVNAFHTSLGLDPRHTKILRPQRSYGIPLQPVNVDDISNDPSNTNALWLPQENAGDFLYTYDPNTVLGVRPADCPVIMASGETSRGRILTLTHIASLGAEAGFVKQMFEKFEDLEIDKGTLQVYVTPGAQAENYPYEKAQNPMREGLEKLFVNIRPVQIKDRKTGEEIDGYKFNIDTPNFVYNELLRLGLSNEQVFVDTSDTARADSGYSSHGRAIRSTTEVNSRDLIIARMNQA